MDIRAHIEERGLSRQVICHEAGISASYLSMIEGGDRRIGASKAARLAAALGVSVADLRPDLAELFGKAAE